MMEIYVEVGVAVLGQADPRGESQKPKNRSFPFPALPSSPALLSFSTRGCSFPFGGRAASCGQLRGLLSYNPPSTQFFLFSSQSALNPLSNVSPKSRGRRRRLIVFISQRMKLRFR